ncbi:TPA: hypothetical protein ACH3X2_004399 [Trebouxia sp. C0005]
MNPVAKLNCVRACVTKLPAGRQFHATSCCSPLGCPARAPVSAFPRQRFPACTRSARLQQRQQAVPIRQALHAVQQQEAPASHSTCCDASSDPDFLIDQAQLQKLAQSRGTHLFDGSTVANVFQLASVLRTSLEFGLVTDASDLEKRAASFGSNTLPVKQETSFLELVKDALSDFTVLILLASGVISFALGVTVDTSDAGWIEGAAILVAVAVVVLVTATNDYQKEKQFKELNKASEGGQVTVLRDAEVQDISIFDLLVGDVMLFETGDIMPADAVIITGNTIRVDESQLTGEADDVLKDANEDPLLLSGSKVLEGNGRALVIAVGSNSQAGIIANLARGSEDSPGLRETTVLEAKLEELASFIGQLGLGAGLLAFGALASQYSWQKFVVEGQTWDWSFAPDYLRFLITAITILVVAIPEGLPLAVTIALAYSVKRMLKDNNLVRHLGAAETMGTATTICTDKTGTLTQNDMQVVRMWIGGADFQQLDALQPMQPVEEGAWQDIPLGLDPRVRDLLGNSVALNTTASVKQADDSDAFVRVGNRTECALLELCAKLGVEVGPLQQAHQIVQVYPFSSDRKRMTSITFQTGASIEGMMCARLFTKGAAEIILDLCTTRIRDDSGVARITDEEKQQLLADFSQDGNRTLAIAYRDIFMPFQSNAEGQQWGGEEYAAQKVEKDLTLIALVGIQDPLRPQVPASIAQCHRAGITVRMLTGDSSTTACAIARECGILSAEEQPILGLPHDLMPLSATKSTLESSWSSMDETSPSVQDSHDRSMSGSHASTSSSSDSQDSASTALSTPVQDVVGNGRAGSRGASSPSSCFSQTSSGSNGASSSTGDEAAADATLVLEGKQFRDFVVGPNGIIDRMAFTAIWPRLRVLARCSPQDKYTIVSALKADPAEIVAMTGDGTNDAPALRNADVGFAMMSGTSIAKDASDILLLDNNFTSVVDAVKWGRSVYAGITKFLQFQLTVNVVAVSTACIGAIAVQESPLTAVQMLWLNLIMDSLASLALATEPPTDAMLDLPPYSARQSLLTPTVTKHIVGQSVFQLAVMYGLVFFGDQIFGVPSAHTVQGPSQHYTLVFNAFVLMQLFNQVNARKVYDEANVLAGILSNQLFLAILLGEASLQVVIIQYGGKWFQTVPLTPVQWAACTGIGALSLAVRAGLRLIPTNKK